SLNVVRMAVPNAADRDPGDEVDVGVAVLVDDVAAAGPPHRQARTEGASMQARRHVALLERDDLARAGADLAPLVVGHRSTSLEPALFMVDSGRRSPLLRRHGRRGP